MRVSTAATVTIIAALLAGCGDHLASKEETVSAQGPAKSLCRDATGVIVSDAWIRASRAGQPTSAAYLTLTNCSDADDALIAVSFAGAGAAELHATAMSSDGMVSMTQAMTVFIAAGDTISLEPGGGHIMLIGLVDAVAIGANPQMTLEFKMADGLTVTFDVRDAVHSDD